MTPTPPAPRVTTERVHQAISEMMPRSAGVSIALDLLDARERIAELEATIENENMRGEPPSAGWYVFRSSYPRAWDHSPSGYFVEEAAGGWRWITPDGDGESVWVAASTARQAMRDANAARGPT